MKSEVLKHFDMTYLNEIALILFLIVFIGYTFYTLNPKRKAYYEDASRLPFEDDQTNSGVNNERK